MKIKKEKSCSLKNRVKIKKCELCSKTFEGFGASKFCGKDCVKRTRKDFIQKYHASPLNNLSKVKIIKIIKIFKILEKVSPDIFELPELEFSAVVEKELEKINLEKEKDILGKFSISSLLNIIKILNKKTQSRNFLKI
jgi:hypothetical protein